MSDTTSVERAFAILELFERERRPLSLRELSDSCRIPASTCHSLVHTLLTRSYLYQTGRRKDLYPTRRLHDLGATILAHDQLLRRLLPAMEALRDATRETVVLGKRQKERIVYLEVLEGPEVIRYSARPGDTKPLHSTCIGKTMLAAMKHEDVRRFLAEHPPTAITGNTMVKPEMLLADLEKGRKAGVFATRGENVPDVTALAIPVSVNNELFGLAVAGPSHRIDGRLDAVAQALKATQRTLVDQGIAGHGGIRWAGPMTFRFQHSDDVRHRVEDGVLFVTIDRPAKRNPLSLGVLDSIRRIFTEAVTDEQIRVAVVTGAGDKAFASGGDIGELMAYRSREDAEAFSRHGKTALDAIRLFPVPVVARLNGLALGGGAELAMACDQRYAAPHAKIGFIHGRLAIAPSWGGGNDLVRLLGPARALRLMASAATLSTSEAQAVGMVDLACPEGVEFDGWFDEQLAPFRAHPRQVMRACKAIANGSRGSARAEADAIETRHFGEVWAHEDHWQAVSQLERKWR